MSLLIEEGYAGYGIYLSILEILRDAPNYRYNPDPKVWRYLLHGDDAAIIERVLKNYGLFDIDSNGLLFSPWLLEQLENYSEKKAKLQEAGRRGAAKRWAAAHKEDGQAIATPSMEDGQAIAYNITQSNKILPNISLSNPTDSWRSVLEEERLLITEELYKKLDELHGTSEGHGYGYLLQECYRRKISLGAFNFILSHSNNAELTNSTYRAFCALCKRVDAEKYPVKLPDNFYLSKLFEK